MKKKALAIVLALCMVLSMLPMSVFAAQPQAVVKTAPVKLDELPRELPAISTQAKYAVSLSGGSHGTTELLVSSPAASGSEVYFLADPDDEYLAEIYVDGIDPEEVYYIGADTWGFYMPSNKVTIEVKYVAAEGTSHRLKLHSGEGGQAELSRTSAKENESVYLAVLPDNQSGFDPTQYVFANSGLLYYLYMDEDTGIHFYELYMPDERVNVFAEYKKSGPFRINAFLDSGDQSATVKIEPEQARFLDTVTVTIIPAEGHELTRAHAVSWAGDLVSDLTPIGNNQYTFTMHPANVELHICADPIPEPPSVHNITWSVNPSYAGYIELSHTSAFPGEKVTMTYHATPGYYLQTRKVNVNGLQWVSDETYTFIMPNYDVHVSGDYRPYFNYARVAVENNGLGGTATLSGDGGIPGSKITLTCIPDEGYRVARITGVDGLVDNGDNTYTFAMPGGVDVNLMVLFLRENNPFLDINETRFFYDSVLWAYEKGITTGMTDTGFSPDLSCKRSQVVTFLWRAAGSPEPETTEHSFLDVKKGSFYEKAVLWAVENEITEGTDNAHFNPDLPCTRAQVVTFLWRAAGRPAASGEIPFEDVPADKWYTDPIRWAVENEITFGMTDTEFGTEGTCTRGQVVTFLYRVYN